MARSRSTTSTRRKKSTARKTAAKSRSASKTKRAPNLAARRESLALPAAAVMAAATAPGPARVEFIEEIVFDFCRTPNQQTGETYVHPLTKFAEFKSASVADLKFHENGETGPVLENDLQIFASDLDLFLSSNGVNPTVNPAVARSAIVNGARDSQQPMQFLLDTVVANYH